MRNRQYPFDRMLPVLLTEKFNTESNYQKQKNFVKLLVSCAKTHYNKNELYAQKRIMRRGE